MHRKRYGGCGVFRKESDILPANKYSNFGEGPDQLGVVTEPPIGEEEELAIEEENKHKTLPLRKLDKLKTEKKPTKNRKNTQMIFGSRRSVSAMSNGESGDEKGTTDQARKFGNTLGLPGRSGGKDYAGMSKEIARHSERLKPNKMFNTLGLKQPQKLIEDSAESLVTTSAKPDNEPGQALLRM